MDESRNRARLRRYRRLGLLAILAGAAALRVRGADFGLPALNDADEPLFMMTAFEMLQKQTLNPHWFGHPATTTLYCLALVMVGVAGFGIASGRYADLEAFGSAAYADPGLVWYPARLFIVFCGVLCVYLTWRLGRRLGGDRVGLIAAGFLAANAVHVEYSQIIRTDVQATVFMLSCALSALSILRDGKRRDYLIAGVFAGLACATKWPAALIAAGPLCAGAWRARSDPGEWPRLLAFGVAAIGTLLVVSPYLLLDHQTVLRNLSGEARPIHPGATGGGLLDNLGWYVANPLLSSMGLVGLMLALAGTVWPWRKAREWAIAVVPGFALYLLAIGEQPLRWERWIVPLLPFAALAAARALCGLADLPRQRRPGRFPLAEGAAALLLVAPMLQTVRSEAAERRHDTRQIASAWLRRNAPAGSTILLEHAGIDLLQGPWNFRYPLGSAGCVDARDALAGRIRYSDVENRRSGSPVVDIGHVSSRTLDSCRADFAVISHYDRYLADAGDFEAQLARYRAVLRGGRERTVFRPARGKVGGPVVRVVDLRPGTPSARDEVGQAVGGQHLR